MIAKLRFLVAVLFFTGCLLSASIGNDFTTPIQTPRLAIADSEVVKMFESQPKTINLLYGLKEHRDPYLRIIEQYEHNDLCTVDKYNNKFIQRLLTNYRFSLEKYQAFKTVVKQPEQHLLDPRIASHMIALMDDAISKEEVTEGMEEIDLTILLCLKAIDYTIEHGGKIHFLLDGISTDMIFSELKEKGYTNAELKYIYRNWERLKKGVLFYNKGRLTTAPWITESNSDQWSKYGKHLTRVPF